MADRHFIRSFVVLAGAAVLAFTASMLQAAEISWRASSVQGPREPGANHRLGVAIFSGGEPATYHRRIVPASTPADGRMLIDVESTYRFADGSTIVMRSRETINLGPDNRHGADQWSGSGVITAGSGRFAGISGSFEYRARMGVDAGADGVLGDSFLVGKGSYTLPAAKP